MLLGFAGLGYAFRRSRGQALASAPVLPRRPFFGGPGRLPPIAMAGPAQEGFGGPKDPRRPLSAWMLTQARWATHGDAVRVCSLSRARPSGPSGPPLLTWVPAGAFPFCATFHQAQTRASRRTCRGGGQARRGRAQDDCGRTEGRRYLKRVAGWRASRYHPTLR